MTTTVTGFDRVVMNMMNRFGFTATYVQRTTSTSDYDPQTGEYTSIVTEYPVQAMLFDLTLQSNGLGNKINTLLEQGDKQLLVRPYSKQFPLQDEFSIHPVSDRIVINGVNYKIVTFKELNPSASDPILYELYIRK